MPFLPHLSLFPVPHKPLIELLALFGLIISSLSISSLRLFELSLLPFPGLVLAQSSNNLAPLFTTSSFSPTFLPSGEASGVSANEQLAPLSFSLRAVVGGVAGM